MNKIIIAIIIAVFTFTACGEKPIAVEYANLCQPENDKKTISVNGYLNTGTMMSYSTSGSSKTASLNFSAEPKGEKFILATFPVGTGSNEMEELPRGFKKEDLKLKTNDGATVGMNDKVRLTGIATTKSDALNAAVQPCYLKVTQIDKAQ